MTYKCKSNDKFVTYLLNNESKIRRRLELYLMTGNEGASDNLNITSHKTGRERGVLTFWNMNIINATLLHKIYGVYVLNLNTLVRGSDVKSAIAKVLYMIKSKF